MIRYNPKNWFTLVFEIHRSQMMRYALPNMLLLGVFSAGVSYLLIEEFPGHFQLKMGIHSLIGIVLGLVLVFRTNTAYDRWWEGRKLWGALINFSRSLSIKCDLMIPPAERRDRRLMATNISNFAFALKDHLRSVPDAAKLEQSLYDDIEALARAKHLPNKLAWMIQKKFQDWLAAGHITGEQLLILNRDLDGLVDVLGGCERILKTPIPYSYSMYVKKFVFLYLFTLPFGLVDEFQYWTIPAVMFITYILLGIELLAEEIEDPFGEDANDLDTEGMCDTIKNNVWEILDHKENEGVRS